MKTFKNKAVVVTGAGRGIGFGICEAFAAAGANVALSDIDEAAAKNATVKINRQVKAEHVFPYAFDISNVDDTRKMIDDFSAKQGRLDILIANAGVTHYGPFLECAPEDFNRIVAVNLRGSFFTAQAAAQKMIELGTENGRILLMSSVTGHGGFLNLSVYGMTKAAIQHLAKSFAVELGKHGITTNAISPGAILTERTKAEDPNYAENWATVTPSGRVGYVNDIVETALFLASPAASHITGQTITVDGGWTVVNKLPPEHPEMPVDKK